MDAADPAGRLNPTSRMDQGRGKAGAVRGPVPLGVTLSPRAGLHLRQGLSLTPRQDPGAPVSTLPPRDVRASLVFLWNWTKRTKGHSFWKRVFY